MAQHGTTQTGLYLGLIEPSEQKRLPIGYALTGAKAG